MLWAVWFSLTITITKMFVNENKMISLTITITITKNIINYNYNYNYNENNNNENSSLFSLIQNNKNSATWTIRHKWERKMRYFYYAICKLLWKLVYSWSWIHPCFKGFRSSEQIVKQRVNTHNFAYSLNYCYYVQLYM